MNDTIFLNPAYASFVPANNVSVNYLGYGGEFDTSGRNYSVSIQDGRNPLFQAGAAFTVRQDAAFVHLGVSKAVIQRLGFGLGGKFIIDSTARTNGADAVFSMAAVPLDWLQAALVVDNIFESDLGKSRSMYREIILGTKFNIKGITLLYFDPHFTPSLPNGSKYGFESGLEITVMADLFLRLGAFRDSLVPQLAARGRGYTAGLGWVAPKVSLDYGLQRALEPFAVTTHSFGMTIYF